MILVWNVCFSLRAFILYFKSSCYILYFTKSWNNILLNLGLKLRADVCYLNREPLEIPVSHFFFSFLEDFQFALFFFHLFLILLHIHYFIWFTSCLFCSFQLSWRSVQDDEFILNFYWKITNSPLLSEILSNKIILQACLVQVMKADTKTYLPLFLPHENNVGCPCGALNFLNEVNVN